MNTQQLTERIIFLRKQGLNLSKIRWVLGCKYDDVKKVCREADLLPKKVETLEDVYNTLSDKQKKLFAYVVTMSAYKEVLNDN